MSKRIGEWTLQDVASALNMGKQALANLHAQVQQQEDFLSELNGIFKMLSDQEKMKQEKNKCHLEASAEGEPPQLLPTP